MALKIKINRLAEICFSLILISGIFLVWSYYPIIKISSKTAAKVIVNDQNKLIWQNGLGLSIACHYIKEKEIFNKYPVILSSDLIHDLMQKYSLFLIEMTLHPKKEILQIDLRAHLTAYIKDDKNKEIYPKNIEAANFYNDPVLESLLIDTFESTINNNAPLGTVNRIAYGLLLFDKNEYKSSRFDLHLPQIFNSESNVGACKFSY
ncbi:MAG: hypothetical protein ACMUIU_09630 [bacterium]